MSTYTLDLDEATPDSQVGNVDLLTSFGLLKDRPTVTVILCPHPYPRQSSAAHCLAICNATHPILVAAVASEDTVADACTEAPHGRQQGYCIIKSQNLSRYSRIVARPDFQNSGAGLPLHVTTFPSGMSRVDFRMRDMRVCR
jgi:hypothetical protein